MTPGATCSLPTCKAPAVTKLRAVDGDFAFCAHHATQYEALGYRRLEEAQSQGSGVDPDQ